jgi:hypothetical protein
VNLSVFCLRDPIKAAAWIQLMLLEQIMTMWVTYQHSPSTSYYLYRFNLR